VSKRRFVIKGGRVRGESQSCGGGAQGDIGDGLGGGYISRGERRKKRRGTKNGTWQESSEKTYGESRGKGVKIQG